MAGVLVVDDDPDLCMLMEIWLGRAGHDVVGLSSGEEALAHMAATGAPDVAVLDVMMDGMSGLDVLAAMRDDATLSHVPTVILSGLVHEGTARRDRELRATYLAKPVTTHVLLEAVEEALRDAAAAATDARPAEPGPRAG